VTLAAIVPTVEIILFGNTSFDFIQKIYENNSYFYNLSKNKISFYLISLLIFIQLFQILYDIFFVSKFINKINEFLSNKILITLIKSKVKNTLKQDYSWFSNLINNDIRRMTNGLVKSSLYILINSFFFTLFLFFIIKFSKINFKIEFFLIIILIILIYFFFNFNIKNYLQKNGLSLSFKLQERERFFRDLYYSIKSLKFYKKLEFITSAAYANSKGIYALFTVEETVPNIPLRIIELFFFISFILIAFITDKNDIYILFPSFVIVFIFTLKSISLFNEVNKYLNTFYLNRASIIKCLNFFSNSEKEKNFQKIININIIKLINISYLVNKVRVLDKINMSVNKGDKILLVGPNGSGKTTLIELILNLYKPTSGKILYNNVEAKSNLLSAYYFTINGVLYDIPILQNICLTNDLGSINYNRLSTILKYLGISKLLNKSDKEISLNNISAGEKQKILLARALYQDSQLTIFDESFSNIDSISERAIFILFEKLFDRNKTLIFISNKLTNVNFFDKIYLIKNKKVIKINHLEALKKFTYFYKNQ
jgi:ABC-type multidrug transport system fused ATPase/permease subunit